MACWRALTALEIDDGGALCVRWGDNREFGSCGFSWFGGAKRAPPSTIVVGARPSDDREFHMTGRRVRRMTARPAALRLRPARPGMSTDTLSEVLRAVRLTGAVFFAVDASAPWVAEAPPAREIGAAHHARRRARHRVPRGHRRARAGAASSDEPPVRLEAGDVIVFPAGRRARDVERARHARRRPTRAARPSARASRLPIALQAGRRRRRARRADLRLSRLRRAPVQSAARRPAARDPRARATRADDGVLEPVRRARARGVDGAARRRRVRARAAERAPVRRGRAPLPRDLAAETTRLARRAARREHRPRARRSSTIAPRTTGASTSWRARSGCRARCSPSASRTSSASRRCSTSRSGACSSPPTLLSSTSQSLAEIAERVGYGSEAALSRAFKRWVGVAPADWRRGKRSAAPPPLEVVTPGKRSAAAHLRREVLLLWQTVGRAARSRRSLRAAPPKTEVSVRSAVPRLSGRDPNGVRPFGGRLDELSLRHIEQPENENGIARGRPVGSFDDLPHASDLSLA